MTEKIYNDYNQLKQFTENASHEIQTPLSVILNKIEMLIQSENFSEEQLAEEFMLLKCYLQLTERGRFHESKYITPWI